MLTVALQATEIPSGKVYDPVIQQMVEMLKSSMINHSSYFLMPGLWHVYKPLLCKYVCGDEPALHDRLERISMRNRRLLARIADDHVWQAPDSPRQRVISILDTISADSNFSLLASDCLQTLDDFDALVAVCLEWGSSLYRHGQEKVYICTRMLRQYAKTHSDLDVSVMEFVAAHPKLEGLSKAALFTILAELLRSKHIAPSRYVSLIMARGNIREPWMAAQVRNSLVFP